MSKKFTLLRLNCSFSPNSHHLKRLVYFSSDEIYHPPQDQPDRGHSGPFACDLCSFVAKSKKGLFYHKRSFHENPQTGRTKHPVEKPTTFIAEPPPVSQDSIPCPDIPPASPPDSAGDAQDTLQDITLEGDCLTFSFPISRVFHCPVDNCTFQSKTKSWFTSNSSLKRHLAVFHKRRNISTRTQCKICLAVLKSKPSKHNCLKEVGLFSARPRENLQWLCQECGVDFPSKTGLDNHSLAHKKTIIRANETPLQIPVPPKVRRDSRKKRIQQHAEGPPTNVPLAAPALPHQQENNVEQIPERPENI
ncbi:hypothetical protein TNCT_555191 [Trichonephila clavata]|uniref:C2H2-type domain-containing protein n=1 Tax=Trichonephila clavata TaxID=2740835 RepID=A0A8X6KVQ0_TRICU|nr:hypothetical protein TNCT_555191 [Trichonephila clavata]